MIGKLTVEIATVATGTAIVVATRLVIAWWALLDMVRRSLNRARARREA